MSFPLPQFGVPDYHFGFAAAYVDLPKATSDRGLYLITMHNKSGASDESVRMRQVQSDSIVRWLRNLQAAESSGPAPRFTPIVVIGDMNVVPGVSMRPYETLLTGDIADERQFGPDIELDWDGTDLADAMPSLNGEEEFYYTWRNDELDFPPSALDRIIFSDSVMSIDRKFVLDTTTMSESDLLALGLQHSDVLHSGKSGAYDHLPLFTDFVLHAVLKNP